jgi:aerobic-type carbon monoxide dehydrogenase small subunit (CoxS/CutS family)
MKICLVGLDNLPVLAPEYRGHTVGGESVRRHCSPGRSPSTATKLSMVTAERPHPAQAAFIAEQAAQCGYCTNGMVRSRAVSRGSDRMAA